MHAVKAEADSATVVQDARSRVKHTESERNATSRACKAATAMQVMSGTKTGAFCHGIAPGNRYSYH